MNLIILAGAIFCAWVLHEDAKLTGRNKVYASVMGFFLGVIGIIIYQLVKKQKWMQDPQAKTKKK